MRADTGRLRVIAPVPDDPPEAAGRSPGQLVRELRTRRGLSLEQLAAATKIPVSSLRHIEADEFDALPGPVFVKGFLRCCARALGVEAEHLVEPFEDWNSRAASTPPAEGDAAPSPGGPPQVTARPPARPSGAWATAKWRLETANLALWAVVVLFVLVVVSAAFQLGAGSR
ncbi:MAG: helix-turn-helix domain-containing protein [Deltaproteobacteria bacterium]|nr:MAG: helix-turn-helix domain-containing protein [Deltaproteobacteria bacterium]